MRRRHSDAPHRCPTARPADDRRVRPRRCVDGTSGVRRGTPSWAVVGRPRSLSRCGVWCHPSVSTTRDLRASKGASRWTITTGWPCAQHYLHPPPSPPDPSSHSHSRCSPPPPRFCTPATRPAVIPTFPRRPRSPSPASAAVTPCAAVASSAPRPPPVAPRRPHGRRRRAPTGPPAPTVGNVTW